MSSSKTILGRIEKRLRKVESKVSDIKDQNEENNNNIEDLYDTINNIKSTDNQSHVQTVIPLNSVIQKGGHIQTVNNNVFKKKIYGVRKINMN